MKLLNIEKTMAENKDVYQKMLQLARQWSTEARQIDSDVNRQFREHVAYRERYDTKQKSLFNVLTAYSMYNSEVSISDFFSNLWMCGLEFREFSIDYQYTFRSSYLLLR